jgi:hypothetical protein
VPTLLEVEGFRFYFFSFEGNEPPHVHVRKADGKAKLWLSPVELVYARRFTKAQVRRILELTQDHAAYFLQRWEEYFHR